MKIRLKLFTFFVLIPLVSCSIFRNLDDIDLEKVLLEPGQDYQGLYVNEAEIVQEMTLDYSSAVQGKFQDLLGRDGEDVGGIMILLIRSSIKRKEQYDFHSFMESQEGVIPHEYQNISEKSSLFATDNTIHSVFIECEALVSLSIERRGDDAADASRLWSLSKQIHENVENYVCK